MYLFKGRAGDLLADIEKKKLAVKHEAPLQLMKSTSYTGNPQDTKVTFQPMERVYSEFRRVWNTKGYQDHLTAKDKQRGII